MAINVKTSRWYDHMLPSERYRAIRALSEVNFRGRATNPDIIITHINSLHRVGLLTDRERDLEIRRIQHLNRRANRQR